jgi:ABC-type transporter Mla maintaining outer membrane lipid asymmetry ATPase subunit MlaF
MTEKTKDETSPLLPIEMIGVAITAMQDPDFITLKDVNWSVAGGEFWVVGAPQHSGKSDFLMTTAGLIPPAQGRYKFFGNETRIFDEARLADRLRMGFVFENAELFHYLTVAENTTLPLRYHRNLNPEDAAKAADELLELTGLKAIADVSPANLPRNWHKRANLARALALQPDILLVDNPLGALDARHSLWWLRFLNELNRPHQWLGGKPLTIVVTTDDFRPWRSDTHRFALLKDNSFVTLGSWNDVMASDEPLVKELLATPIQEIVAPLKP